MLRILMLDLGETLVHGGRPFPQVLQALQVVQQFETSAGEPLLLCLVSDYHMPRPPVTPTKIAAIFQQYLQELDNFGLTQFFEPVGKHVTVSTHAGVHKPDRRIFETAVQRLGVNADLDECLFITENAQHIAACRAMGMTALQFAGSASAPGDFHDWSEAPLLLARLVAPERDSNRHLALQLRLMVTHQFQLTRMDRAGERGSVHARGKTLYSLTNSSLGTWSGVHVEVPTEAVIRLDPKGRISSIQIMPPDAATLREATDHLRTLIDNQQLAAGAGTIAPGATHQIEVDAEGRRCLKRKRFSAI